MADEISQETIDTEQTAEDTGSPVEADSGSTEGGSEGNQLADQTTTQQTSRAQERITKLIEERNALRAELEAARQAEEPTGKTGKQAPAMKLADDNQAHPALMGQVPDEDGQVLVNGRWVDAQDLIERYELKQALDEVRSLVTTDQKARQQAELDARENMHRQELANAVLDRVAEVRAAQYSDLKDDHADAVDGLVTRMIEGPIAKAFHDGTFTPEIGEKIIKQAFDDVKKFGGIFAASQLASNEQYASQHRVQPGTPGTKAAKSIHEMTQKEIDAQSRIWAAKAEEQARSGRV